jgi:hypothetical protein
MRRIQFDSMERLCEAYEPHGLRGTFNVEVMQQLGHLRCAEAHPELGELAAEWERVVQDIYRRGHDVQLHLHPQWTEASYEEGKWELLGRWSILEYERSAVDQMIGEAKRYLEQLLLPIDPEYRCVSFRSGSWCIAPGGDVLRALAGAGIVFDMSIVNGLRLDTQHVRLDYREIDEPFLPFFPDLDDARRLAAEPQPIVCIPTHSFQGGGGASLSRGVARSLRRVRGVHYSLDQFVAPSDVAIADSGFEEDYGRRHWSNRRMTSAAGDDGPARASLRGSRRTLAQIGARITQTRVSDLSRLSLGEMRVMLRDVRRRARDSDWDLVPIVLANHTKDLGNFVPLERFAAEVADADDLEVVTATEVARNIDRGLYPIRLAGG